MANFADTIFSQLIFSEESSTESLASKESLIVDFVALVCTSFLYFTDEEKLYFANQPYAMAESMSLILKEKYMCKAQARDIVRVLGDFCSLKDQLCTHLISGPGSNAKFDLIRCL